MIVDPDQEFQIRYREGWSCPSGSASFGAKVASSLNGVDPSFINSVAGSYLVKPSGSNTLHDIRDKLEGLSPPP